MPNSNAGKFPVQGKVVDRIGREMTQQTYDELTKISKVQDEHGHVLARHGATLDKIDATLARHTSILRQHTAKLNSLDSRFTELDGRLNQLDTRFGELDGRLNQLGTQFEQVDATVGQLKNTVVGMDRNLRTVRTMLGSHEMLFHAWGQKIDDTQNTVDEMEAKVDLIVRHLGILKE